VRVIRMAVLVCLSACLFEASAEEGIWLSFQVSVQSQSSPSITDSFRAFVSGRENVLMGLDSFDVLKPPANPGGDSIRAVTRDSGNDLAIDFRPGSENSVDAVFPLEIFLRTDKPEGLTGKVQRFESSGHFVQKTDLRQGSSIVEWDVTGLTGKAGLLRLVIVRDCIAVNIDRKDSVNLADMALLSADWRKTDYIGPEDVDGNASVDLADLAMLAEAWLQRCP
jgi:hypothetical protein